LRAGVLAALIPVLRVVREQEAKLLKVLLDPVAQFLLAQPCGRGPVWRLWQLGRAGRDEARRQGHSPERALRSPSSITRTSSKMPETLESAVRFDEGVIRAPSTDAPRPAALTGDFDRLKRIQVKAAHGVPISCVLGWSLKMIGKPGEERTFLNYPMQADAAELMRLIIVRGSHLPLIGCAHDSFIVEDTIERIKQAWPISPISPLARQRNAGWKASRAS
jgi:hypothetical protein